MFRDLRERVLDPLVLGGYLVLLGIGAQLESRGGWVTALALIVFVAFFAWMMSLRRARAIGDMPTSRIGSAAQGYVELVGQGRNQRDFPVLSKLTQLPCLWYRYVVEQRTDKNKWERVDSGRSSETFILEDESGQCLVDPDHAEVVPRRKETWHQGDYRYTEWLILANETMYALGEFSTVGGQNLELDLKRDVSALLADWKRDHPDLLSRFDLDRDGQISEKEWMLARSQARREVKKTHNELRTQPGTHLLHQPRDGRLFLISNIDPARLSRRYTIWAWLHLAVLLGAVSAGSWLVTLPL
ncbi:MAG: hypothetical protein ACT4PQ_13050 [Betaproteobacteria bacterium]